MSIVCNQREATFEVLHQLWALSVVTNYTMNVSNQSSQRKESSTFRKRSEHSNKQSRRWKPESQRSAQLMKMAHQRALQQHTAITESKANSTAKKPSRAVTSSQKLRKRSAEICRLKFPIYIDLMEKECKEKRQACETLKREIGRKHIDMGHLKDRIEDLERIRMGLERLSDETGQLAFEEQNHLNFING